MAKLKATGATASVPVLGKLTTLGLTEPWHVALLLPDSYDDFTTLIDRFGAATMNEPVAMDLAVTSPPQMRFDRRTRLSVQLRDQDGVVRRAFAFGNFSAWQERLVSDSRILALVRAKAFGDTLLIDLIEPIEPSWHGRVRPHYPVSANLIGAATVRARIEELLDGAIPRAAQELAERLSFAVLPELLANLGAAGWTIKQLLEQAHRPRDLEYGRHAQSVLERLATIAALARVEASRPTGRARRAFTLATLPQRIGAFTFPFTSEQAAAVRTLADDLGSGAPLRAILIGDVATGKTATFGAIAAAGVDAGARVLVLLPNTVLAQQVARELGSVFPDLSISLVLGDNDTVPAPGPRLIVATTAALARDCGPIDLCIVDEQQKFSTAQREQYVSADSHLLEATATCIPRSLALAKYGALRVCTLSRPHHARAIETTLWERRDWHVLYRGIAETIRNRHQVLVVYPAREEGEGEYATRHNVSDAAARWSQYFPGAVRALTGANTASEKAEVMADLHSGTASMLVATSVVEVGVNLERLRRVVIVNPERFGLSTLHQIRGRVARNGGTGLCDLFLASGITDEQRDRLAVLVASNNGFDIARSDLERRGFGDLGPEGKRQSGADELMLFGRPLTPAHVEAVFDVWQRHRAPRA
jgi:ATP-dependent DNA helicase RecG